METIIADLKEEIIRSLGLTLKPEEIDIDASLFADGLGLDSIDTLEIIVILEKKYKIKITDAKQAKAIFVSIRTLAEFVEKNRK